MEAKAYRVTNVTDWDSDPSESWYYHLVPESMTAAEREAVRDSKLRTRHGGYGLRREALAAAEIDAKDIRRAARARTVGV